MSQTYQSRVFSFISRRTSQLKDTCVKGWRHLKVTVVWSGQILLHPLQILAQATKILKPQLPPARQQPPSLPQASPDLNIEEALDLIQTAGYAINIPIPESFDSPPPQPESSSSTSTYQPPQPRLANFIAALTSRLGDSLSSGTSRSSANPNSKGRQILTFNKSEQDNSFLDRHPADTSTLNTVDDNYQINYSPSQPTIRGLSSLLSDRQIVLVTTENELINTLTITQQQQIRHRIGIDLATTWEQWQTSRLDRKQPTQTRLNKSPALLTSESNSTTESLFDRFSNWLSNFSRAPEHSPSPIELEILPSQVHPQQLEPAQYSAPFVNRIRQREQWLNLPQLPPITEIDRDPNPAAQIIPFTPIDFLTKLQPNWLKRWVNYYQDYIYIPNDSREIVLPSSGEVVPVVEEFKLTPMGPKYDIIKLDSKISQSRVAEISVRSRPDKIEYQPDWIDTTAEEIGYSRSPLSRLLMWLDRIAVKIENWLIRIWQLLQHSADPKT